MTSLPATHRQRSSAWSSISTPASAARPARRAARNGTPAAIPRRSPTRIPTARDPHGAWLNRVHSYEVGDGGAEPHGAFPALVPALRDAGLRHRLPDRRLLQARRGRHRAGQPRHLHRLQAVLLGLPLRRARIRLRRRRDEEMHAVRRPHLQRDLRAGGPHPGLRARLPDRRAAFRRSRRSRRARCRSSSRSAAASICCRSSASSRSTNICRRGRASDQRRRAARRAASCRSALRRARTPTGSSPGSTRRCRAELSARCIPPIRSSSSPRHRAPATAC